MTDNTEPTEIWLQYHGDAEDDGYVPVDQHNHDEGVTWCREKVFDRDIHFVRADEVERIKRERDKLLSAAKEAVGRLGSTNPLAIGFHRENQVRLEVEAAIAECEAGG